MSDEIKLDSKEKFTLEKLLLTLTTKTRVNIVEDGVSIFDDYAYRLKEKLNAKLKQEVFIVSAKDKKKLVVIIC